MFGIKERREARMHKLAETARKAAGQRASYPDAVREVLKSDVPLALWVGSIKIDGSKGACTVGYENREWYGPDELLRRVERLRTLLGKKYSVSGGAWATVSSPSFGLAMDIASGYSNPRLHAMDFKTVQVTIDSQADVDRLRSALHHVRNSWVHVKKR